jgi:hypothetical protein
MRVIVAPRTRHYDKPLKHDDVVVVPEFSCDQDDNKMYYQLIKEMESLQKNK